MGKISDQLGEALIKESMVNENQLQHALQIQQDSLEKKRLGQILIELGYLTKRQLREVSRKYNFRQQIGEVLVEQELLTEEQLAEALDEQKATRKPIGEILVEKGLITEEQFARAVSDQLDYPFILPHKRLIDRLLLQQFSAPFLKQYTVLPIFKNQDTTTVIVHDPYDRDMMRMLMGLLKGGQAELAVAPKSIIASVLNDVLEERSLLSRTMQTNIDDTTNTTFQRYDLDSAQMSMSSANQVISIVDYILTNALSQRASDIHIDTMYNRLRVRHRIDGSLIFETDLPQNIADGVIRRIKVLSKINPSDTADVQDGTIYVKFMNNNIDLRVAIFPTVLGTSITIRTLNKDMGLKGLGDLGMLPRGLMTLKQILDTPAGMILFAGPTGSGKTTSMYACLNYLNHDNLKICTIESPVEFSIEGVAQCQLKSTDKDTIHEKVRAIMHQDPDVIVMGEINNTDTAMAAVQAALTGHKVFSTIHTEDSFGGLMRLMEMGLRTFLLSSTGIASIAQRLVRKICLHCKEKLSPDREMLKGFHLEGLDPDSLDFFGGAGCLSCHHTGFFGRTGIFEILIMDDAVRNAFLDNKNASHIRHLTQETNQFLSLREAGFIKALQGETTMDEVISILSYSEMQAFSQMHLSDVQIRYWMGAEGVEAL